MNPAVQNKYVKMDPRKPNPETFLEDLEKNPDMKPLKELLEEVESKIGR